MTLLILSAQIFSNLSALRRHICNSLGSRTALSSAQSRSRRTNWPSRQSACRGKVSTVFTGPSSCTLSCSPPSGGDGASSLASGSNDEEPEKPHVCSGIDCLLSFVVAVVLLLSLWPPPSPQPTRTHYSLFSQKLLPQFCELMMNN